MQKSQLPLFAILILLAAVGCANPADGKSEAVVAEPEAQPTEKAEGVVHTIGEGSSVSWVGSKVSGKHEGGFENFEGEIVLVNDDPTASRVDVTIDMTSIWSDDERLTGHLKSDDFFETETYPTATFSSTSIVESDEGYSVTGNLDMHGVEKSITFPATITVGEGTVEAMAEFVIKRFDWNIEYKGRADDLIRDEVVITFDLKATTAG